MNALALAADMLTMQQHDQQLLHISKALARSDVATGLTAEQVRYASRMNGVAQCLLGQVLMRVSPANDGVFSTVAN